MRNLVFEVDGIISPILKREHAHLAVPKQSNDLEGYAERPLPELELRSYRPPKMPPRKSQTSAAARAKGKATTTTTISPEPQTTGPLSAAEYRERAERALRAVTDLETTTSSSKSRRGTRDGGAGEPSDSAMTIIQISEPISSALHQLQQNENNQASVPRTSDVSNSSLNDNGPTPASLEADLEHYRELFAKLRFSYVEQVTKEKFIRAIVGDPPLIVTPQENAELEEQNLAAKASLKRLKVEVQEMVSDLEGRARDLASRYESIQTQKVQLKELPQKLEELERKVEELKSQQAVSAQQGEEMNMPLGKTMVLVEERRKIAREMERELAMLSNSVPRKRKEMERLALEVGSLETKRAHSEQAAREAQRRREMSRQGGLEDDLEAKGRWYRASEAAVRGMLDLK